MYQKVIIVGNLGRDPEMHYFDDGTAITNFSVAVNEVYGSGDDRVERTAWFRVSVTRKTAEACNQHLIKGQRVLVEGQLKFDSTTGGPIMFRRKDDTVGASFEIKGHTVKFLSKPGEGSGDPGYGTGQGHRDAYGDEEDQIPF